jgi:hypothetical protein
MDNNNNNKNSIEIIWFDNIRLKVYFLLYIIEKKERCYFYLLIEFYWRT